MYKSNYMTFVLYQYDICLDNERSRKQNFFQINLCGLSVVSMRPFVNLDVKYLLLLEHSRKPHTIAIVLLTQNY